MAVSERAVARMWARDPTLWKPRPEDDVELSNRLGWLTLPADFLKLSTRLEQFTQATIQRGITHAVVCGMGGSSLAPEVFRITFPTADGHPTLHVLDSTDPGAIKAVDAAIDPRHTLFVISSKSGGTLEVMSFLGHFWELAEHRGDQFCAITDPGTSLDKLATERGFLKIFRNPTEIGGRYSALSYFGTGARRADRDRPEAPARSRAERESERSGSDNEPGPGARRLLRRPCPRRPRQADHPDLAPDRELRPVGRAAHRREHR